MTKFMLLYRGAPTDMSAMSQEEVGAEMAKWGAWAEGVGADMLDMGAPFAASTSICDDGSEASATGLTGYGIVQANDLEGAKAHCKGHPYLVAESGDYYIDVFEMVEMPGM